MLIEGRKNPKFLVWFIPVLLILVSSTYITYTSLLGYPKFEIPQRGLYLKHYIDEPNWIYMWVIDKEQIPKSYKIVYSREVHNALEGVEGKSEEGKFMVLSGDIAKAHQVKGEKGEEDTGGYTIGGNIGFYEWDYESSRPQKDPRR